VFAGTGGNGALFTVDPATGSRTLLSDLGNGTQGPTGANVGIAIFTVATSPVDRFVNPNNTCPPAQVGGNPAYNTIQDAVNDARPGDVIFVCPGTYQENVVIGVDKLSLLALPPVQQAAAPRRPQRLATGGLKEAHEERRQGAAAPDFPIEGKSAEMIAVVSEGRLGMRTKGGAAQRALIGP
jgi:hypothetical protein